MSVLRQPAAQARAEDRARRHGFRTAQGAQGRCTAAVALSLREIPGIRGEHTGRPYATITLVVLSLFGYLVLFPVSLIDIGVARPINGQWWRVATSPFLYGSIWYELAAVTAIAVFGWLLERRHGRLVVLFLFVLCGMGGIALAVAVDPTRWRSAATARRWGCSARGSSDLIARSRGEDYDGDPLGTAVFAAVLRSCPSRS